MNEIHVVRMERVALITLNRPAQLNAFNDDMIEQWADALRLLRDDPDVNVIVITGEGDKAFCAGGDLQGLAESMERSALDRKNELWTNIHRVAFELQQIDKPVIASINGVAVGAGFDMALLCDLRFMADTAKVSEGYIKIGLVPGDGGAWLLPRAVGIAKALEMLWTGDFYDANQSLQLGLVNRVYPTAELIDSTLEFARQLANGPTVAIRMMKRAVYQSASLDMRTAFDLMSSHFAIIRETADHREGIRAMMERRRPQFIGK